MALRKLELSDLDPMPFGKYYGTPMQDVPASYLHWLYHNNDISDLAVINYIHNSWNALKEETPDLIWSKKK